MTHVQAIAYLVTALGFATPTAGAVKYSLQFLKGLLPVPKTDPGKSNATRLYALAFGMVILPAGAAAWAYTGFGPPYDKHAIPFDVVVGAAAGLAAIADYHLIQALQGIVSGGSIASTLIPASNAVPVPPPVPVSEPVKPTA